MRKLLVHQDCARPKAAPFRPARPGRHALGALALAAAAFGLALAAAAFGPALADELTWNGTNLGALGIHKGLGLPILNGFYSGSTNLPTLPPGLPGNTFAFRVRTTYDFSDALADEDGHHVKEVKKVNVTAIQFRTTWILPWQPADPHFRFVYDMIIPVATVHADVGDPIGLGAGGGGLGDIVIEPLELLYALDTPSIATSHVWGPVVVAPTGDYQKDHVFNLGQNIWEFMLQWEWWVTLKQLGGLQFHGISLYTHATENADFVLGGSTVENRFLTGKDESHYKSGDMIDMNADVTIPIPGVHPWGSDMHAGALIAWEHQIEEDKLDGNKVHNSRQEGIAVGPVFYWSKGPFNFYLRGAFDVHTRNNLVHNTLAAEVTYFFPGGSRAESH